MQARKMYGNPDRKEWYREQAQHIANEEQRPVAVYALGEPAKLFLCVRPTYRFLRDVKLRNANAGYHFFEPSTMRFFSSRVQERIYVAKDGRAYFVTSERYCATAPGGGKFRRFYTVRVAEPSGDIKTVGEFQQYATGRAAHAAARKAAGL